MFLLLRKERSTERPCTQEPLHSSLLPFSLFYFLSSLCVLRTEVNSCLRRIIKRFKLYVRVSKLGCRQFQTSLKLETLDPSSS